MIGRNFGGLIRCHATCERPPRYAFLAEFNFYYVTFRPVSPRHCERRGSLSNNNPGCIQISEIAEHRPPHKNTFPVDRNSDGIDNATRCSRPGATRCLVSRPIFWAIRHPSLVCSNPDTDRLVLEGRSYRCLPVRVYPNRPRACSPLASDAVKSPVQTSCA